MTRLHCKNVLYTATVMLDSSVNTTRRPCSGEMVTYTCTVTQGFALEWIVEPFISVSDTIQFVLDTTPIRTSVDCNGVTPPQCSNITFVATFTNTANHMTITSGPVADMTSTLTITAAVRLNGTVVQCRGSTAAPTPIVNSSTLNVAGAPVLQIASTHTLKADMSYLWPVGLEAYSTHELSVTW